MVMTFAAVLIGLMLLIRPLQRNSFYVLHCALVVLSAWYVEGHWFRVSAFHYKTFLLFLVFHFISINIITILAYWKDKRAAVSGGWRVPEAQLHTLEFLGGWSGALLAQKMFRHKTRKKSFRAVFWLMLVLQVFAVWIILKYLRIIA